MSKKTNKFEDQLNGLIVKGDRLHWAMLHECHGDEIEKLIPKDKGKQFLKNLPRFKVSYTNLVFRIYVFSKAGVAG